MRIRCKKRSAGFTLIELVMVVVLLGIVGVYVVPRNVSPADVTLPSQAQKMASDLRHAQALASTGGASLCFVTGASNYYVSVKSVSTCGATPVTDPATGNAFSVNLQKGVVFSSGANSSLIFNSFGQPGGTASFTLSSGSATYAVSVAATTGKVIP